MRLMKNLLLLSLLLSLFAFQATAQVKVKSKDIRRATKEQAALYQLDAKQVDQMANIKEQELLNLAAIEVLKQRDYEQYLQKKQNIRHYVEAATRRILRAEQLESFEKLQEQRDQEREVLLRALKKKNADQLERRAALLRLEESWQ